MHFVVSATQLQMLNCVIFRNLKRTGFILYKQGIIGEREIIWFEWKQLLWQESTPEEELRFF